MTHEARQLSTALCTCAANLAMILKLCTTLKHSNLHDGIAHQATAPHVLCPVKCTLSVPQAITHVLIVIIAVHKYRLHIANRHTLEIMTTCIHLCIFIRSDFLFTSRAMKQFTPTKDRRQNNN